MMLLLLLLMMLRMILQSQLDAEGVGPSSLTGELVGLI
jgi:hypothetical protein